MLGDDIIDAPVPCMKQMMNVFESYGGPVVAVQQVPRAEISAYGVIDGTPEGDTGRLYRVKDMVEKPKAEEAPSDLAIIGRYLLTPDIFEEIEKTERGTGGEIQLTDGPAPPGRGSARSTAISSRACATTRATSSAS
jgi:UTP--glucose-1-phosphate uridylyltransferase